MVAFTRLNYSRITHSIRGLTHHLPFTTQRLKFVLVILMLMILFLQLLLLFNSKSTIDPGRVLVLDRSSKVSTHYKYLLKKHSENFPSFPLQKKCSLYFKELYSIDHDWEVIDPTINTDEKYDKAIFNKAKFIEDRVNVFRQTYNMEPSEGKKAEFELEYQRAVASTFKTEQSMIDAVTHLRVFGACYLNDKQYSTSRFLNSWFNNDDELDGIVEGGSLELCTSIEQRLFPWLSRELPVYTRWDGERVLGIPKMSKYIDVTRYDENNDDIPSLNTPPPTTPSASIKKKFLGAKRSTNGPKGAHRCFLNDLRSHLNGRGIVLSVADKYESDIIGLLRVLRALNNALPIQLVHKGDLSEDVQKRITKIARSDDVKVPKFLYDKIKDDIPHNFPKQEVWFVNAKRCIRREYHDSFNGFANKLIAYLFNSFDDMLLMDTDSIPLVKPNKLFQSGPYKRTNTIFFKDRFNVEKVSKHDSNYFLKLMPNSVDESLFEIPRAGNVTLNNRYINDQFRHVMEAGMVGVKRSTHFIGILTSIQLNFWAATSSRIWGDKELFWLGQSVSGNENYEFNKHDVVAVGELTPMEDRPKNTIAHELCSTHPGHLSGDDDRTLLWINSGMRYCKLDNTWQEDFNHDRYKKHFKTFEDLADFYKKPARINAVLIPPGGDRTVLNDKDEPARGWAMTDPCRGYLWCAYDVVGGSVDPRDRGMYIQYDNVTENIYDYIGKLWLDQDLLNLSTYETEVLKEIEKERLLEIKKVQEAAEFKAKAEIEAKKQAALEALQKSEAEEARKELNAMREKQQEQERREREEEQKQREQERREREEEEKQREQKRREKEKQKEESAKNQNQGGSNHDEGGIIGEEQVQPDGAVKIVNLANDADRE